MRTLTREQVREFDRCAIQEYGVPGVVLMENAARGAVDVLEQLGIRGPIVLCCGRGNNGGDGFVMARHLQLRGHGVSVWVAGEMSQIAGDAATNLKIIQRSGLKPLEYCAAKSRSFQSDLESADWIVDALLGTGATGEPRPPFKEMLRQMNAAPARRMAVDVPSGIDCDLGTASNTAFQADHTCSFVAAKPGLLSATSRLYVGQLHVIDIGAPLALRERFGVDYVR